MPIETTTTSHHQPSINGEGSKSALDFNSYVCIDMKQFSQSELYSLSLDTSDDVLDAQNDVVPNVNSDHRPTASITSTSTTPRRIYAFSHRRRPHRHISGSDSDTDVTENKLILKSLQKLIANGGDTAVVVENPSGGPKRKRKRKVKREGGIETETETEGLGLVNVNGEVVDLVRMARGADGAFESELKRRTEGMVNEDEFLGFLNGLEGRWGSTRRRRKYVDAAVFVNKALPVGWKILLSLRPRVRRPVLYCRRFVSPSDEHFKSCKDVAFHLKSQFATSNVNAGPSGVDLESGAQVQSSSHPAPKVNVSETNNLDKASTSNLINCDASRDSLTPVVELESHMQTCNGNNNQQGALTRKWSVPPGFVPIRAPNYVPLIIQNSERQKTVVENKGAQVDVLTRKLSVSVPPGFLPIQEPAPPILQNSETQKTVFENKDTVTRRNELKNIPMNGEGSSNEQENDSEGKGNLKTRCFWCSVEFIREPVDAETLASSSGFICSKCKQVASWSFESALSRLTQRSDN